jgi:nickel transport system substrate-binding protein
VGFSPISPMMQDRAVRDAIFLGIDRTAVATVLFAGYADPTADIFPTTVPTAGARTLVPARDVAAAQAVLTADGWTGDGAGWTKDGTALEIAFLVSEDSFSASRRIAQMVQGMLMQVGVKTNIETVDNATMHGHRPKLEYGLTFFGTYGAPYDPHGSLGPSFVTASDTGPDGKIYVHPNLDVLVATALETGGDAPEGAMQAVHDWLRDTTAACPLVVNKRLWAVHPRVAGFPLPATDCDLPFKGVTLG